MGKFFSHVTSQCQSPKTMFDCLKGILLKYFPYSLTKAKAFDTHEKFLWNKNQMRTHMNSTVFTICIRTDRPEQTV